ncbi:methyltransferase domain-containing protein [Natronomonas halophila]|uniref:methyltransferase domain-containing protein n=1 Tax=Natronomonas halophila TaxID=2747817 RepID=UPI0015B654A0|nr:methyltransferase domain-containing protein [Natronomonas halophila]QLD86946.1 methyltransferase domain-containing protein [Natronomonas halophila]
MGDSLEYTEAEAKQEEATYRTPSMGSRRRLVRDRLDLRAGEDVLSLGCGPGFEPAELAEAVGPEGHVHAIDRSEAMLALAKRRCGGNPRVTLTEADVTDVPLSDESVDAATAVQVYAYVDALDTALAELHRVLRPGGRAVVYDTDFDSLVWHSSDSERTERVLTAFDDHCPRPHLGSRLGPRLRDAGLTVERVEPNSILNTRLDEDTFSYHLMAAIRDYVVDRDLIAVDEADAWVEDLRRIEERGETFFSLTQYLYVVRKADD